MPLLTLHLKGSRMWFPFQVIAKRQSKGPIVEFFPKDTDFDRPSDKDIFEIQRGVNSRPRKVFGFSTTIEQLYLLTGIDAHVAFQP